jgi:hypothetical protein
VREVFDIGAKDKAELKRSDWLKFDGSLFGGGGDTPLINGTKGNQKNGRGMGDRK